MNKAITLSEFTLGEFCRGWEINRLSPHRQMVSNTEMEPTVLARR